MEHCGSRGNLWRWSHGRIVWAGLAALAWAGGCSTGSETTPGGAPVSTIGGGADGPADDPISHETDGDADLDTDGPADGGIPGAPSGNCPPGEIAECYTGPAGTEGVGLCTAGMATCMANGTWGPCEGVVTPIKESCNSRDDDCNGAVDDVEAAGSCNTGMAGACSMGVAQCNGAQLVCMSTVQPAPGDMCGDGIDNDCNGAVDDGCGGMGGMGGGLCNPMNPGPVCGPGKHCFPSPTGATSCQGPTGGGVQYDECSSDANCVPNHTCVDVGGVAYCLQWCTNFLECPLELDDCVPLDPAVGAGGQMFGVCYDGLG